jgi:glycosyltransferase 2 family protein
VNRLASRVLRVGVAAGLTAYLLWISHPADIAAALGGTRLSWVALACGLVIADRALMAWRWLGLLAPITPGTPPPLRVVLRIFFVSTFVGTFLPASVGGDAVRAYSLTRHGVPGGVAMASVVMDRALGVLSILMAGALGLLLYGALAPAGTGLVLILGLAGCTLLALIVFSEAAAGLTARLCDRLPVARVKRLAHSLLDAMRQYRAHHAAMAAVLALSLGVQGLRVMQAWCLGRAIGIEAPFIVYVASVPIILLVMLLPISINGLGTGQAAFLWSFSTAGVPRAEAFTLSLLFVALGVVGNLPGGLLYASGGISGRTPS